MRDPGVEEHPVGGRGRERVQATLRHQGGPRTPEECARFRADPLHDAKLRLRAWDEEAKVPGLRVEGLDAYRPLLHAHLAEGGPNPS